MSLHDTSDTDVLSLNDVNVVRLDDKALQQSALGSNRVFGGAYRDRTDDLLNANQALSQLS